MSKVDVFETTLQKTEEILKHIMEPLGWDQEQRAYVALRAVLQALRDRLPVNEAVHLGAQLPMLVRGIYYEGWTPLDKPIKMHRQEFLERIHEAFRDDPQIDPVRVTRTVIEVLLAHLGRNQMSKIAYQLPAEYADLWPVEAA
jgi:uncharacterized protein (DUF2267 family)